MSIVLSTERAYLPMACLSISSLVESAKKNLKAQKPLDIWLLIDGVSREDRAAAEAFLSGLDATCHMVDSHNPWCLEAAARRRRSPAAFARLVVERLIKPQGSRVIYLDADTRAVEDVRALYDVDLGDTVLGAVDDIGVLADNRREFLCKKLKISPQARYFNSGVLVIDIDRWERERIGERALSVFVETPEILTFNDQDALNATLKGHWTPLPVRWNKLIGSAPPDWPEAICHFAGEWKPWRLGWLSGIPGMASLAGGASHVSWYETHLKNSPWSDVLNPLALTKQTAKNAAILAWWYGSGLMARYRRRHSSPHLAAYRARYPEAFA